MVLEDIIRIKDPIKRNELIELSDFYKSDNISKYLNKWVKEDYEKFNWRKEVSYYKNFVAPIINGLTNLIYIKKHIYNISDNRYLENIDLKNTPLNKFLQSVTKNALLEGLTFIFADTNKWNDNISKADEVALNIRGYLKEFTYKQLINYRYEDNILKSIVLEDYEDYYINDFKSERAKIYYHLYIGGGTKYILREGNKIELLRSWNNSLDYIPITIIHGSLDSEFLSANSIVKNIKDLNKSHYNLNSGIMNISHIASSPIPIMFGLPQNANGDSFKLGVNSLILFPTNQGNAYKFEWSEIKGDSVAVAERELARLEDYITEMSFDILRVEKFTTATEAKIKENKNKSILNLIINSLESGINKSLQHLEDLTNTKIGDITYNKDISNITINPEILNNLLQLRANGDLSIDTLLNILVEGEVLNIDDIEKEKERISDEREKGVI